MFLSMLELKTCLFTIPNNVPGEFQYSITWTGINYENRYVIKSFFIQYAAFFSVLFFNNKLIMKIKIADYPIAWCINNIEKKVIRGTETT